MAQSLEDRWTMKCGEREKQIGKDIAKELKMEEERARDETTRTDESDKLLCKAIPEQLFKEIVMNIVDPHG